MSPTSCCQYEQVSSRREFLTRAGFGFGAVALGHLLHQEFLLAADPLAPRSGHFPAKAKSVIFLFMQGGPSHLDTFDPKPILTHLDGKLLPPSFQADGLQLQFTNALESKLMGSRRTFQKCGKSGLEISDLFENLREFADDLAIIRSCYHESFIHGPALSLLHSGSILLGHPSVGSWLVYGLGRETANLPAYIVMTDSQLAIGSAAFGSGFLPAIYQGTLVRTEGSPIQNLSPPVELNLSDQRRILDRVQKWNQRHLEARKGDTSLSARIANYELAFRMQTEAPELINISKESHSTREMYGVDQEATSKFGRMCLLARRMVERGVRFVQLNNSDWDGHGECDKNHVTNARAIDQPIAALLGDLKQRGLLESTLVVWTGEFGRTPTMQGKNGRDHNPYGFTSWMAGGGIQGGKVVGATDELGFRAVEDKVHVHDLHATMLSLLGLDHKRLTFFFQGRDRRLTDVGGENNLADRLTRRSS